MDVTLSVRALLVVLMLLVALAVGYLLGGRGPAATASTEPATAGERRTVTMAAVGEATAVPDELEFTLVVAVERPALETALDDSNALVRQALGTLAEHGIAEKDTRTTGLQMEPVYDYSERQEVLRGYQVVQRTRVRVHDLAAGGRAVSAVVAGGGNEVRVNDIQLSVADPEAALGTAREQAVTKATAKAEQYAAAAGVTLGSIVALSEVSAPPAPQPQALEMRAASADAAGAVAFQPGEQALTAQVQVVWEVER